MRENVADLGDWRQFACNDPAVAGPLLDWCEGLGGCTSQADLARLAGLSPSSLERFGAGKGGRGGRRTLERVLRFVHLPLWLPCVTMLPSLRVARGLWHRPAHENADPELRQMAMELVARTAVVAFLAKHGPGSPGPDTGAHLHPADARVLFAWLKALTGLNLRALAIGAGVCHETLRLYAAGKARIATPDLPGMVEGMGGPVWVVEAVMLPAVRTVRWVAEHPRPDTLLAGWEEALRKAPAAVRVDPVWYSAGELLAAAERRPGERLWCVLVGQSAAARVRLVKRRSDLHRWELVVWLCTESEAAAAVSARVALRLALLALRVARCTRGEGLFDLLLEGYALIHVANAWRAGGQPGRAEQLFARGLALWKAGELANDGRLPAWRVLDLEGSLLRDLRRFPEAIERLDTAQALAPRTAWGRILIKKATVLDQQIEPEASLAVLQQAAPCLDERREPHLVFIWAFLVGVNQCHLGRYEAAVEVLPRAQALAAGLDKPIDRWRLDWLRGRIEAGLGNEAVALAVLTAVQSAFHEMRMAYDYALVSLELGEVLLRQGRYEAVQALALEMEWIFERQGIPQEAEKALRLFRQAAEGRSATPELAGQVLRFLYKAQHNPGAQFAA